jgi:tRNA(Ile)-lysidine synthase
MINAQTIKPYLTPNSTIIVGFSGGPDSVCLLTLLAQLQQELNLTIIAAHLDHQWRPESGQDAAWCKEFCQQLANVLFIAQASSSLNISIKYNGSKEELGRKLRRNFFQQLAQKHNANHIALANHLDDQLETFFIRLIRGGSVTGLAGMQQQDGLYVRPLLHVSKQEILDFLQQHRIPFLTDATNVILNFYEIESDISSCHNSILLILDSPKIWHQA